MNEEIKRLFFGVEVHAAWPSSLLHGRILDETQRHLTLAFLGNVPFAPLAKILNDCPSLPMRTGSVGFFDSCVMLPPRHPHVVAWQANWWSGGSQLQDYQLILSEWLAAHHYAVDRRPWKPHVTLCRQPFIIEEWLKAFKPLPFYTSHVHLYESKGDLRYLPIVSFPVQAPFEEISHTADLAFNVYGESLQQLYFHAFAALALNAPELIDYLILGKPIASLVDIIVLLNAIICRADAEIGCPMKAVSFHGEIMVQLDSLLKWEMIVDV